jgi:hypothetical protein
MAMRSRGIGRPTNAALQSGPRRSSPKDEGRPELINEDADLRALLETLDPKARDDFRCVLIRDQADRDEISSRLMRYRDQNGQDWADIIDFLTMWPEARRQVTRILGEIEALHDLIDGGGHPGSVLTAIWPRFGHASWRRGVWTCVTAASWWWAPGDSNPEPAD